MIIREIFEHFLNKQALITNIPKIRHKQNYLSIQRQNIDLRICTTILAVMETFYDNCLFILRIISQKALKIQKLLENCLKIKNNSTKYKNRTKSDYFPLELTTNNTFHFYHHLWL